MKLLEKPTNLKRVQQGDSDPVYSVDVTNIDSDKDVFARFEFFTFSTVSKAIAAESGLDLITEDGKNLVFTEYEPHSVVNTDSVSPPASLQVAFADSLAVERHAYIARTVEVAGITGNHAHVQEFPLATVWTEVEYNQDTWKRVYQ